MGLLEGEEKAPSFVLSKGSTEPCNHTSAVVVLPRPLSCLTEDLKIRQWYKKEKLAHFYVWFFQTNSSRVFSGRQKIVYLMIMTDNGTAGGS